MTGRFPCHDCARSVETENPECIREQLCWDCLVRRQIKALRLEVQLLRKRVVALEKWRRG